MGLVIILILISLMIYATTVGDGKLGPMKKGPEEIIGGIYLQFWGILFFSELFFLTQVFFLQRIDRDM